MEIYSYVIKAVLLSFNSYTYIFVIYFKICFNKLQNIKVEVIVVVIHVRFVFKIFIIFFIHKLILLVVVTFFPESYTFYYYNMKIDLSKIISAIYFTCLRYAI